MSEQEKINYEPRDYQLELFHAAIEDNIVACLGTGTGKTFISILLIKDLSHQIRKPLSEGGKRTVFLVPTVPLVDQQTKVIKKHTDLQVDGYWGEKGVDFWTGDRWEVEFEKNQVLVMVAEVYRNVVSHGFFPLSKINLIIFDECHRAVGNHPYREIMRLFHNYPEPYPRIMGLTASVLNGKCSASKLGKHICHLEMTLKCKALVASDVTSISKFGTKPKEMLVYYNLPEETLIESNTPNQRIRDLFDLADKYLEVAKKRKPDFKLEVEPENLDMFHPHRDCKHFASDIKEVMKDMGIWCAHNLVCLSIMELEKNILRTNEPESLRIYDKIKSIYENIRKQMEILMSTEMKQDLILTNIPHKLLRLLGLLKTKNPLGSVNYDQSEALCGIVFVQKRVTAYILNAWLQEVAKYQPYKFLKTDFVVGHGMLQAVEGKQTFNSNKQKEVLEKFRKEEINLLLASSVIEEGMDIRQCNLVIRYDPPLDYRSFIQSKGRARAKKSIFVIMIPKDKEEVVKFLKDIVNYKTIEKILLKMCLDRQVPDHLDSEKHLSSDVPELPYQPFDYVGAPIISLTSSISTVYKYCSLLPSDRFTRHYPFSRIITCHVEGSSQDEYICQMKMPINSVIKDWVTGKQMAMKTYAKMSAALAVCKLLHEAGELDDKHLLPIPIKLSILPEEELDEVDSSINNNTHCFQKKIAKIIEGVPPQANCTFYVTVIHMKLDKLKPGSEQAPASLKLDPQMSPRFYAVITPRALPLLCNFPVFNMAGKLEVELVTLPEKFILSHEGRETLAKFQYATFTELLKLEETLLYYNVDKPSLALFIGAVFKEGEKFTLDWSFMESVNKAYSRKMFINLPAQLQRTNDVQKTSKKENKTCEIPIDFRDAVVFPAYKTDNKHPLYVYKISDKTVKSAFINKKFKDYEEYYSSAYGVKHFDYSRNMLECFFCDKPWLPVPQYLNRFCVVTSNQNKYDRRYCLPVDICEIQATPASMRKLAVCLPVVLYRINSLLLVHDLKTIVSMATGIGSQVESAICAPIECNWNLLDYKLKQKEAKNNAKMFAYGELVDDDLILEDIEDDEIIDQKSKDVIDEDFENPKEMYNILTSVFDNRRRGQLKSSLIDLDENPKLELLKLPKLSVLLEAITALNASDFLNLERLETVGDAFLKYATSMYEFHTHPLFNEGHLTVLKMRQISNSKLRKIGIKMKLHEMLNYNKFEPSATFLPPAFHVQDGLEEAYAEFKPNMQSLFLYGDIDSLKKLNSEELNEKLKRDNSPNADNKGLKKHMISLRTMQYLGDKSIADLVEALIGSYVSSCGTKGTLLFMSWLGLKVLPERPQEEREALLQQNTPPILAQYYTDIPRPLTALLKDTELYQNRMQELLSGFEKLERQIGYVFKDRSYLLQAFTHTSYNGMHVTDCYQRLEFLGDAVLDYVITRHLYADPMEFCPGEMSDLRQALVNNTFFAMLAVKYNLHKYLKYASPLLLGVIDTFATKVQESSTKDLLEEVPLMLNEIDCECAEEIEVPKVLGDVVESLAGAIYLDSGYSFNKVWEVFQPMMIRELEHYRKRIPINPVRQLIELFPEKKAVFSDALKVKSGTAVKVSVFVDQEEHKFCGYGVNRRQAKLTAAKLALRKLVKNSK